MVHATRIALLAVSPLRVGGLRSAHVDAGVVTRNGVACSGPYPATVQADKMIAYVTYGVRPVIYTECSEEDSEQDHLRLRMALHTSATVMKSWKVTEDKHSCKTTD